MRVVVLGAGGRLGRVLVRQLSGRGDHVVGVVRAGGRGGEQVGENGGEVVHADVVTDDLTRAFRGADAVVFAAAGTASRYQDVDHQGVARAVEAAQQGDVARFVLVSANGAHAPASWGPAYQDYLQAKADGEQALRASGLAWTVVRPAALVEGPGTGWVHLQTSPGGSGSIPRADVAATVLAVLDAPATTGLTLEVWGGSTPVPDAVARAVGTS